MSKLSLYSYFRSSAAYRVRIALNLKGLSYDTRYINLIKDGGEQHSSHYHQINPQGLVPALVANDQSIITQSLAIIEYLNERHPEPPLLPGSAIQRAQIRAFALAISCDIHPLNNLRVQTYLKDELNANDADKMTWYHHWIRIGFSALEQQLSATNNNSLFCFGDTPTMADACLIPQIYNAIRFNLDLSDYRTLKNIYSHCIELEAFHEASPENQPDCPEYKEA
ncbi:maleylacetoacetate isomerase [Pseudomonadota bacterium]